MPIPEIISPRPTGPDHSPVEYWQSNALGVGAAARLMRTMLPDDTFAHMAKQMLPKEQADSAIEALVNDVDFRLQTLAENSSLRADKAISELQINELKKQATIDPLTGVLNLRGLEQTYSRNIDHNHNLPFGAEQRSGYTPDTQVLVFDLDGLKAVNTNHGHDGGNETLKIFAKLITDNLRPSDAIGRIGGDEFVGIMFNCGKERAMEAAAAIIQETPELTNGRVTVSCGVGKAGPNELLASIMGRADDALYVVKKGAKNGVLHIDDMQR